MRVLVDADACPVKEIILRQAKRRGVETVMICDTSHVLRGEGCTVITVDKGRDSADLRLANLLRAGDVVVTQDYGVAALALGRGAKALGPQGLIYSAGNMDALLMERHLGAKARRGGQKTAHIKKRTRADDESFERALCALLDDGARDRGGELS